MASAASGGPSTASSLAAPDFYSLTLQKASAIHQLAIGRFTSGQQELVVGRGKVLELLRSDGSTVAADVFGKIRQVATLPVDGQLDHVLLTTDSGRLVILAFDPTAYEFTKVHQEQLGKPGCRRNVPGQYCSADPYGRLIVVAAVEESLVAFGCTRSDDAHMTLQPARLNKPQTLFFAVTALDVGQHGSPQFACLEVSYPTPDAEPVKHLSFYELNAAGTVTCLASRPCERTAHLLVPMPASDAGPGGVLVFSENWVSYQAAHVETPVMTALPRRVSYPAERGLLVVCCVPLPGITGFVAQTELGDLYVISFEFEGVGVSAMRIHYLDSIAPCAALGYFEDHRLFAAAEFADHYMYQVKSPEEWDLLAESGSAHVSADTIVDAPTFSPRELVNLSQLKAMSSSAPIMQLYAGDLARSGSTQLYALTGRGPRSALRVFRQGAATTTIGSFPLIGALQGMWTVAADPQSDPNAGDKYLIVSSASRTMVLEVTDGSVATVHDTTMFIEDARTLCAGRLRDGSILQVHKHGYRRILPSSGVQSWEVPGLRKEIAAAAMNDMQLVIAAGAELTYFELTDTGFVASLAHSCKQNIVALDIGPSPPLGKCDYAATLGSDSIVRTYSLSHDSLYEELSHFSVAELPDVEPGKDTPVAVSVRMLGTDGVAYGTPVHLLVGTNTGDAMRIDIDRMTGVFNPSTSRKLHVGGGQAVRTARITVNSKSAVGSDRKSAVLCMGSQTWLVDGEPAFRPVPVTALFRLVMATGLQFGNGDTAVLAWSENQLHLFYINYPEGLFHQQAVSLSLTPHRMVMHPKHNLIAVLESDHNMYCKEVRQDLQRLQSRTEDDTAMDGKSEVEVEVKHDDAAALTQQAARIGWPVPPQQGVWSSCIEVVDPTTLAVVYMEELGENQRAHSMCCVVNAEDVVLLVGTSKDADLDSATPATGYVHAYRMDETGRLVCVYTTEVPDVPYSMCALGNRVLVATGRILRLYDVGRKKLLHQCESRAFPTQITQVQAHDNHIYLSDLAESIYFCVFQRSKNAIVAIADEATPRFVSAMACVDPQSVVGADKFGNVFILRTSSHLQEDNDPPALSSKFAVGAPNKAVPIAEFHVGEVITSLQRVTLRTHAEPCILYGTVMGGIGVLFAAASATPSGLPNLRKLEESMHAVAVKSPLAPICLSGNEHQSYRSFACPAHVRDWEATLTCILIHAAQNVIDGDLCERFSHLDAASKAEVAKVMGARAAEIQTLIEETRGRVI